MSKEGSGQIFGVWPYSGETSKGSGKNPKYLATAEGSGIFFRYRLEERTLSPSRLTDESVFLYPLCPAINLGNGQF